MEAVACLNWKTPECRLSLTVTTCAVFNTNFWCVCNKHVCYKCCFTIIMNFFSFWFYSSFENNNVFFANIHLMAHKKQFGKISTQNSTWNSSWYFSTLAQMLEFHLFAANAKAYFSYWLDIKLAAKAMVIFRANG